ncbi:MAG: hypothetical protein AB7O96_05860 [Pseudobdellovibrionaceae bacterium]
MKTSVILYLLISLTSISFAANSEDILRTAWQDPKVKASESTLEIIDSATGINPFSEVQLRLEGTESNTNKKEYGLRLYPKGLSEFTSYRRYQRSLEALGEWQKDDALSSALVNRYSLVSRIAFLQQKKIISQELMSISKKANQALAYYSKKNRSELKSYIKGKTDLYKIDLKIAEIERESVRIEQELESLSLPKAFSIDLKNLASVEDIKKRFKSQESKELPRSAEKLGLELQKLQSSVSYDHAKDSKWLDYFELTVKEDKNQQVFGVGLAFNIPFLSSPDIGRLDKKVKAQMEEVELQNLTTGAEKNLESLAFEIQNMISLYTSMSEDRMNIERLKKASSMIAKQDVLLAVELQKSWFESFEQLSEVEFQIRTLYIQYLHEASVLAANPDVNYLSKNKGRIL